MILLYDRTSKCTDIDKETLRKEQQCAAYPSNNSSSGGTCQEGSVLRWKWGQILLPAPESSLHQPNGVGHGLEKDSTHFTGPGYLRQLTVALGWFLACARKGV